VHWKGFTAESDTWKGKENLKNTKEGILARYGKCSKTRMQGRNI